MPQLQRWHFGMGVCRMWGVILRRSHLVLKKAARHKKHNAYAFLSSSLLGPGPNTTLEQVAGWGNIAEPRYARQAQQLRQVLGKGPKTRVGNKPQVGRLGTLFFEYI